MDSKTKKELVLEHAQKVAQLSMLKNQKKPHDTEIQSIIKRLREIETRLDMSLQQIVNAAINYYRSDY